MSRRLRAELLAELAGMYVLCFFGPGAVAAAVLTGSLSGGWQVASIWGFAIALAIYATGGISGCHINPAVTIALAVYRGFPKANILPYIAAQMLGGMLAALTLAALFLPTCGVFEAAHHLVRGTDGSQLSAMWFGEYFPNPAAYGTGAAAFAQVSVAAAFTGELIGTAFLLFFIFALTDADNPLAPKGLEPLFIGFTVAIVIGVLGPLTQAALNPARDFAPRLVCYFLGWGRVAIPGPRGCEWWLYIVAPILGGLAGGGVYQALRRANVAAEGEAD
jgi:glycerol uptake facilitator protein